MIRLYKTPEEIIDAINIAWSNHLYIDGWGLVRYFIEHVEGGRQDIMQEIALYFDGDTPVGFMSTGTLYNKQNYMMAFVKDDYRGKGIGKSLVQVLHRPGSWARLGIESSEKFWEDNNVIIDCM